MVRRGITNIGSLRQIISNFPDNYLIMTNQVGNLTIYSPEAGNGVGYIDLLNLKYWVELEETPDATYHNFADDKQEGE